MFYLLATFMPLSLSIPIFVFYYSLNLTSILSDINIATPDLFWFPLSWNVFIHPDTFNRLRLLLKLYIASLFHLLYSSAPGYLFDDFK